MLVKIFVIFMALTISVPFSSKAQAEKPVYEPSGKEQFKLREFADESERTAYMSMCRKSTWGQYAMPCGPPIKYEDYVGMNGHFTSDLFVKSDDIYFYRPAILENGEEFFVRFPRHHQEYCSLFSPLEPLDTEKPTTARWRMDCGCDHL